MDAVRSSNEPKIECLLFDLDDTLYPMSTGLNMACRKNIEEYMLRYLNIEESEVPRMCLELYKEYGTTMAGLKALGYEFDNDEFHAYVHGRLPYDTLKPDPVLRNLLLSTPQRRIIFTNADKNHAIQALYRLGLEDCFEGIICFETLNTPLDRPADNSGHKQVDKSLDSTNFYLDEPDEFGIFVEGDSMNEVDQTNYTSSSVVKPRILCKPSLKAMQAAIRIADIDPKKTIFFDDSVRNIASAKTAGLNTVIVGSSVLVPGADIALGSIHNIKEALPEIWEEEKKEDQLEQVLQSSIETIVIA